MMWYYNLIKEGDGTKPLLITLFIGIWVLIGMEFYNGWGYCEISLYIPFMKLRVTIRHRFAKRM